MTDRSPLLRRYIEHLHARIRAQSNTPTATDREEDLAVLPEAVSLLCTSQPEESLALIVEALEEVSSPHLVQAIGDGLLENLLNEHSDLLSEQVATLLHDNQRFRFAFACGMHASVDPSLINEWAGIFQELGTSKQRERKRLWAAGFRK